MATYVGHGGEIYISGILTGQVTSWSYSATGTLIDVTAIGDGAFQYTGGLTDGTFNCEYIYDASDGATAALRQGHTQEIVIYVNGQAQATPVFSGLVTVETFDINASINDVVKCSISGKGNLGETLS